MEAIMRKLAERLGGNPELWGLVGLLHDLDYEETRENFRLHGVKAAERLEGKLPEEALEAIRAHNELTGYSSDSKLTLALKVADRVSGLIIATALVMPNKRLEEVKISSLKKKFKQKDFARSVNREEILTFAGKLKLGLEELLALSLEALKPIGGELGL